MDTSRVVSGLALVGLAIGCGSPDASGGGSDGAGSDDSGLDAGQSTGDGDRTEGMPAVTEIVIPMRPRTGGVLGVTPVLKDIDGPRLHFDSSLTLAVGEGFEEQYTASVAPQWWGTCGSGSGEIRLDSLETTSGEITGTLLDGATIELSNFAEPGVAQLVSRGEVTLDEASCGYPAGTVVAVNLSLSVTSKSVATTRIERPCAGPVVIAPASTRAASLFDRWFSVSLVDEAGETFFVDNAESDAQATVRLRGQFDAAHAEPTSLSVWIAPSTPGWVEIEPEGGEPLAVDVVDASRITDADLEFQIAGAAAGPLTVVDGQSYTGWARAANRLAPMVMQLWVGEQALCSEPDPRWFDLQTTTPTTCSIVDLPSVDDSDGYQLYGNRIGQAAHLDRDGVCGLTVDAPGVDAAAQFPRTFAATFDNVESLLDWE